MGDKSQLHSPIGRARLGVIRWLEELPEPLRDDALEALNTLCSVAEREIEQAYFDGGNHRRASALIREVKRAQEPLQASQS